MLKKLDLWSLFTNMALAFLIGLAGAGCLCTAFSLDVAPGNVLLTCFFWAVAFSAVVHIPKGGWICAGLMALFVLHFWWQERWQNLAALANVLFSHYGSAYGWPVPDVFVSFADAKVTFGVTVIAALCTMWATLSLYLRKSVGAVCAAALPLVPCLVVTDTVPGTLWLFVLLMLVALVLLTANLRRGSPRQASRLCALLVIPTLLAGLLLFGMNPQDTYDKASEEETFGGRVLELLDKLPFVSVDENGEISLDFGTLPSMDLGTLPSFTLGSLPDWTLDSGGNLLPTFTIDPSILDIFKDRVSLENTGPQVPPNINVMQVTTDYRGVLYLRERGYDIYTGTSWDVSDAVQELYLNDLYAGRENQVEIKTYWAHDKYFLPYYRNTGHSLENGYLPNPGKESTYPFAMVTLRDNWMTLWVTKDYSKLQDLEADAPFTDLPRDTATQVAAILENLDIGPATPVVVAAQRIQEYVRNHATYDLNTPAMPEGTADFAVWFLTESDTGYCVHFATAATVLLRAAGIPARYVEGYMVEVTGDTTLVPAKQGHAWVEYFVPSVGWVILEATPGSEDTPVPPETTLPPEPTFPTEPSVPTPPETTLPPVTTEPSEPTVPAPPETTVPTEPTEPTVPTDPTPPTTTEPTLPTESTVPPTTLPGTTAGETTQPSATTPGTPEPPQPRPGLWIALSAVMLTLALACALVGQWQLRLWLRQVWVCRGDSNRQALKLWRLCVYFARLRRQVAPYALRDLAWKAKYSQYAITEEELQSFHDYLTRSVEHLKQRPWYLRVVYRIVFAAY